MKNALILFVVAAITTLTLFAISKLATTFTPFVSGIIVYISVILFIASNCYTLYCYNKAFVEVISELDVLNMQVDKMSDRVSNSIITSTYAVYLFYKENKQPAGAITSLVIGLSEMLANDFENNKEANNINRFSEYISDELKNMDGFSFGENNIRLIVPKILEIRLNKHYSLIEDKFEASFKQIQELISKEQ